MPPSLTRRVNLEYLRALLDDVYEAVDDRSKDCEHIYVELAHLLHPRLSCWITCCSTRSASS